VEGWKLKKGKAERQGQAWEVEVHGRGLGHVYGHGDGSGAASEVKLARQIVLPFAYTVQYLILITCSVTSEPKMEANLTGD